MYIYINKSGLPSLILKDKVQLHMYNPLDIDCWKSGTKIGSSHTQATLKTSLESKGALSAPCDSTGGLL